ncbi:MAG: hypothetical protein H7A01_13425 [Hahellaceae bacterium]|nr:hypothetical protein [Hahellaceae bacterium]MCP5209680.1 hypothetical protein [Hahellaceae bacterium]
MNIHHLFKVTFLFAALSGSVHSLNATATEQPPANNDCGMNTNNCPPEKLIVKEKCGLNTNNCSQGYATLVGVNAQSSTASSTGNSVISAPPPKKGGLDRDIIRRKW